MTKNTLIATTLIAGALFFVSCVPTKKFNDAQQALASARYDSAQLANKVKDLQAAMARKDQQSAKSIDSLNQLIAERQQQIATLNKQIGDLTGKNKDLQ